MIKKVIIENFRSHKHTEVEFGSGLNIICGSSDEGKSALLNAIIWAITNSPGFDFHSHFAGKEPTSVSIEFDNCAIKRVKSKTENHYYLNNVKLEAFRTEVPDVITRLINLKDINIQTQFESHYLLSKSSGQVTKELNSVVGLDVIDSVFSSINKTIKNKNYLCKVLNENIEKTKTNIDDLSWIDVPLLMMEKIEELQKNSNEIQEKISSLNSFRAEIESLSIQRDGLSKRIALERDVERSITMLNDLEKLISCQNEMIVLDSQLDEFNSGLMYEWEVDELIEKSKEYESFGVQLNNLLKIKDERDNLNKKLTNFTNEIEVWTKFYAKEIGDTCPLCNSKLKEEL